MTGKAQITWPEKVAMLEERLAKLSSKDARWESMAQGVDKYADVKQAAAGIAERKGNDAMAHRLYKEAERARKFAQQIRAGGIGEEEVRRTSC
ncbi:hypothetical protein [Erwinia sp. OPT-41]|uniref:Uncharacterized protein n=1 Tax=Erwinia plantamica TaxID=3237104 RepID=A0ABW7CL52_9GAMM